MTSISFASSQVERQILGGLATDSPWLAILEHAGLAIAVLNADFDFVYVNRHFALANGKTLELLRGRNYFDVFPQTRVEQVFRRVRSSGMAHVHTARPFLTNVSPTGEPGDWNWSLRPIGDADYPLTGNARHLLLSIQAAQFTRESAVRHTPELRETVLDGFWLTDLTGRLLDVNETYCRLSGYTRSELLQLTTQQLTAGPTCPMAAIAGDGLPPAGNERVLTRHRRKDGTTWAVEVTTFHSPDSGGRLFSLLRSTGEQKRDEVRLRAHDRLSELAASADLEAHLQIALESAIELTGSTSGTIEMLPTRPPAAGQKAASVLPDERRAESDGNERVLADKHPAATESSERHNEASTPSREMALPIVHEEKVRALLKLANRWGGYSSDDIANVSALAEYAVKAFASRRAETALRASERCLRSLFNAMTCGFAVQEILFSADGIPYDYRFLEVNPAFEAIAGLTRAEIVGQRVSEVMPGIDPRWIERFAAVAVSGDDAHYDDFTSDLGRRYRVTAYRPSGGCCAAVFDDITALWQDEEAIRRAAMVFVHSRDAILITDAATHIVAVNGAFSEITGYSSEEAIGRTVGMLKSGHHGATFYAALWSQLSEHGFWQGEICNRRKNGETYLQWLTITAVVNEAGVTERYIGVFTDITRLRDFGQRAEFIACYDPLTHLPNRTLLNIHFEHALSKAELMNARLALLVLDVDHFKEVNERFGYESGDRLLTAIGERIKSRLRDGDTLARLPGNVFAILMEEVENADDAAVLARDLLEVLATPFRIGGAVAELHVSASIGISISPDDGSTLAILLRKAESAVHKIKAQARGMFRFYAD
ncbi:PAS domain S-box protein [Accumulibacter sp.]|uniref:sensor domain-containing diguanylate cyclase n=1 Tax=Accumulibacter sp. TaxID=2053492 RepID=UPI002BEDA195|nr:PAS domain S-box protein [Accumulibacter sp.]HNG15502.1 PAS domain S-box protein [Accumulibacter sp.]